MGKGNISYYTVVERDGEHYLASVTYPFKFGKGSAGIVQRRIIKYLLDLIDNQFFDQISDAERFELACENVIQKLSQPYKRPFEYITQLRELNVDDCVLSVLGVCPRLSNCGRLPLYYYIPSQHRQNWRDALKGHNALKDDVL